MVPIFQVQSGVDLSNLTADDITSYIETFSSHIVVIIQEEEDVSKHVHAEQHYVLPIV